MLFKFYCKFNGIIVNESSVVEKFYLGVIREYNTLNDTNESIQFDIVKSLE